MAVALKDQPVVTDPGDFHILMNHEDGSIQRIKPTDLGIGGGGGSGLTSYVRNSTTTWPGFATNDLASNASLTSDLVRGVYLPPGDYTGMSACIIPADTDAVATVRFALYAADAGGAIGSLVADLGQASRAAAAPVAPLKTDAIGELPTGGFLVMFTGTMSGNFKFASINAATNTIQPTTLFSLPVWRWESSLTYPAAGAPSTVSVTRGSMSSMYTFLTPTV